MDQQTNHRIDVTRALCPMSLVHIKLGLEKIPVGANCRVDVGSTEAARNLTMALEELGHSFIPLTNTENGKNNPPCLSFLITKNR
jgi:TusA-related sulfurtransferase